MSENRKSPIVPAIVGGVVGAALTASVLLFAAPEMVGSKLVRAGLLADPQILVETADALRAQQFEPILAENRAALEAPFASSWEGAKDADVVLVEFFDYACPYCKASNAHVDQLLREDDKLRVVYREYPILGPDSVAAARVSLAASKAGKFTQFHDALYAAGRPGRETINQAADAVGLTTAEPGDPQIEAELRRNYQLASQLGATGTPLFIVGDQVLNGAVGYDALKAAIADARASS